MKRREFIALVGGAATVWPVRAHAQQSERLRRIGVLESGGIETDQQAGVAVFKEVLHRLGSTATMCGSKSDGLALIPRRLAKTRKN